MPNNENKAEKGEYRPNCLHSFCREFFPCQAWFTVEDPTTLQKLDVPATFGPFGPLPIAGKVVTCGFTVLTQVLSWINSDNLHFYYAYYTSWALAFAVIYTLMSLSNSIYAPKQPTGGIVQGRAMITWVLFNLAAVGQALATLVYWVLVHDWKEKVHYLDVFTHGFVFLVVLADGILIARIPLRWMHLWSTWVVLGIFLIWTVIHSTLNLGNPNEKDDDPDTNDDAIYANLSWNQDDWKKSAILAAIVYLFAAPLLFGCLRTLSLWGVPCCGKDRRRYVQSDVEQG